MSEQQYIKALNKEIKKLNGIIDDKIMHSYNYSREARRHKVLLRQIKREERKRSSLPMFRFLFWV